MKSKYIRGSKVRLAQRATRWTRQVTSVVLALVSTIRGDFRGLHWGEGECRAPILGEACCGLSMPT